LSELREEILTREQVAKAEIGRTAISRSAAWALSLAFMATVFAVPLGQFTLGVRARMTGRGSSAWLGCWDEFRQFPGDFRRASRDAHTLWQRSVKFNSVLLRSINEFQNGLDDQSWLTRWMLPPAQVVLSGMLGMGNEQAYVGRDGWLFYRPGVNYVTGPGFLDAAQLKRRSMTGNEWRPAPQPDPRTAICRFDEQLRKRGIRLIVVPTPVKPTVHPEKLGLWADGDELLQNPSYEAFVDELRSKGVLVFDCAAALMQRKLRSGDPQYLSTDTHWRPDAMEHVAQRLGSFIDEHVQLSPNRTAPHTRKEMAVESHGDITRMLQLPEGQTAFAAERVVIHQVRRGDATWQPDESAEVLVLGDSFSNVYSLEDMNWGAVAGLVPQLSFAMQRPLDCIIKNDDGAYATREKLSGLLAVGRDRLAGKKVVIWQFAARELAVGDWKLLLMEVGKPAERRFLSIAEGSQVVVTGTVSAITLVPRSGDIYNLLVGIHLTDLESRSARLDAEEAVVWMWGLKENRRMKAADLTYGKRITLRLKRLPEKYQSVKIIPFGDDRLDYALDICWAEPEER
jgi:alginate O-acetyltransferase complex protein AlgJ